MSRKTDYISFCISRMTSKQKRNNYHDHVVRKNSKSSRSKIESQIPIKMLWDSSKMGTYKIKKHGYLKKKRKAA